MADIQQYFWSDEVASVTGVKLRTDVPPITPVELKMSWFEGGHETLVYLALQILKTGSKDVAIQAIASAVGILLKQKRDMLGGKGEKKTLTNLDDPAAPVENRDAGDLVGTEWDTGARITAGEVAALMGDMDEIAAFFALMFFAGTKKRTDKNRDAFNKNRIQNVKSTTNEELLIFIENSPLITDKVLDTAYAAFNSFLANRMYLVSQTVHLCAGVYVGPALAFQNMFLLLEDTGLGTLRIIKEAILKYPFIRARMPELASELHAADQGQRAIRRINENERPFCKAIYGNRFVPVAQNDVANLFGVCKKTLAYTVATYRNFEGGSVSERQEEIIQAELEAAGVTTPGSTETPAA